MLLQTQSHILPLMWHVNGIVFHENKARGLQFVMQDICDLLKLIAVGGGGGLIHCGFLANKYARIYMQRNIPHTYTILALSSPKSLPFPGV